MHATVNFSHHNTTKIKPQTVKWTILPWAKWSQCIRFYAQRKGQWSGLAHHFPAWNTFFYLLMEPLLTNCVVEGNCLESQREPALEGTSRWQNAGIFNITVCCSFSFFFCRIVALCFKFWEQFFVQNVSQPPKSAQLQCMVVGFYGVPIWGSFLWMCMGFFLTTNLLLRTELLEQFCSFHQHDRERMCLKLWQCLSPQTRLFVYLLFLGLMTETPPPPLQWLLAVLPTLWVSSMGPAEKQTENDLVFVEMGSSCSPFHTWNRKPRSGCRMIFMAV